MMEIEDLKNLEDVRQSDILKNIEDYTQEVGAVPSAWGLRSFPAVMSYALSKIVQALYSYISWIAKSIEFSPDVEDSVIDLWARSQFNTKRKDAVAAQYLIDISVAADASTQNLTNTFKVGSVGGNVYYLSDSISILPGTTETGTFIAENPGTAGNVEAATITKILTPKTGLSISNQRQSIVGSDREDSITLYNRCIAKWGGIGAASTEFVQAICLDLDPLITKVKTRVDAEVPGLLYVYIGQTELTATPDQVTAVKSLIDSLAVFQAVTVVVQAATIQEFSLTGKVYCKPGTVDVAKTHVAAEISAWQKDLSYGDHIYASDPWRLFQDPTSIHWISAGWLETKIDSWSMTKIVDQLIYIEESG